MLEYQIKPLITLIITIYLLTLGIIFSKTKETIGDQREAFAFKGMLFAFMLYGFVDLRFILDNFFTAFPRWFVMLSTEMGFASMTWACYFWFIYVSTDTNPRRKYATRWYMATSVPLLLSMAMIFTPLNKNLFEITDTLVLHPSLFFLTWIDYIYLILATVISLIKRHRSKTRYEKRKYGTQVLFILFFTFSGFLVGFLMGLPSIELCIIPVVLKIFMDVEDSKINTDALTRLNTRNRITDFYNTEITGSNDMNPLYLIMIDIDFFKSINDILGHDEGDRTLIAFSGALSTLTESKNAMACRWGGDEFIVAAKDKEFATDFREKLTREIDKNSDLTFMPSFSIGIFKCTDSQMPLELALIQADKNLYKDKEIQHQQTDSFHERLIALKKNK